MALPGSGQLAFSQIINEFGTPGGKNLGAFRVSENIGAMSDVRLDTGMPSSGQIAFSNFRGKQLNVVVNFYTGGEETRQNAKNRYDGNNVRVVGGFRGRPSNTDGTRVIIHVNKNIGSEKRGRNKVALRTGTWNNGTNLDLINNGNIYGAGGDGGQGASRSSGAGRGKNGTSGLGIEYPCELWNYGTIRGGGGGGGGGGSGRRDSRRRYRCGWWCEGRRRDRRRSGGGGGGGGKGLPGGNGGGASDRGRRGGDGNLISFGPGGAGGGDGAGDGGNGGTFGNRGADGTRGGNRGGDNGRAILVQGSGALLNVVAGTQGGGVAVEPFS